MEERVEPAGLILITEKSYKFFDDKISHDHICYYMCTVNILIRTS